MALRQTLHPNTYYLSLIRNSFQKIISFILTVITYRKLQSPKTKKLIKRKILFEILSNFQQILHLHLNQKNGTPQYLTSQVDRLVIRGLTMSDQRKWQERMIMNYKTLLFHSDIFC